MECPRASAHIGGRRRLRPARRRSIAGKANSRRDADRGHHHQRRGAQRLGWRHARVSIGSVRCPESVLGLRPGDGSTPANVAEAATAARCPSEAVWCDGLGLLGFRVQAGHADSHLRRTLSFRIVDGQRSSRAVVTSSIEPASVQPASRSAIAAISNRSG